MIEGYRVRTHDRPRAVRATGTLMTLTVRTPRILGRRVDGLVSRVMQRTMAKRERGDIVRLRAALAARAASPAESAAPSSTPAVPPSG